MKIFAFLIALVSFLPGFAFADSPLKLCARYSVWLPDGREDLEAVNHYVLSNYVIDRSRPGREKMIFELPTDLTAGKRIPVQLTVSKQDGANRELTGPMGAANCEGPWASMTCNFKFRAPGVKESDLRWFLTKKYGNTAQRDGLLEIASRFSGDPIGVAKTAALDERCAP